MCLTLDADPDDVKAMCALLDEKGAAHDIGSYRDAPPNPSGAATVETADAGADALDCGGTTVLPEEGGE